MAYTEFTARSGGSNLNAGTLDGSAEAATSPLKTYANGNWDGTSVYTPASGNPQTDGVAAGQWCSVYADGASAPTGYVARVASVTSSTVTLSTTAKVGSAPASGATGNTLVVGGAWAGPAGSSGFPLNFVTTAATDSGLHPPRVNLKNDQTYSVTAGTTCSQTAGSVTLQGYAAAFGDRGRAVIDGGATGTTFVVLSVSGAGYTFADLTVQNNGNSGSSNLIANTNTRNVYRRVVAANAAGTGFNTTQTALYDGCEAYNCNLSGTALLAGFNSTSTAPPVYRNCASHGHVNAVATSGFRTTSFAVYEFCVSFGNTGNASSHGFALAAAGSGYFLGCVAYGNGGDGINVANAVIAAGVVNCALVNNTGYGINSGANPNASAVESVNSAFYGNAAPTNNVAVATGTITLAAQPFANPAAGNFTTASPQLKGAGYDAFTIVMGSLGSTTTSAADVGASQSGPSGRGRVGGFLRVR